jgi:hypothetical protein
MMYAQNPGGATHLDRPYTGQSLRKRTHDGHYCGDALLSDAEFSVSAELLQRANVAVSTASKQVPLAPLGRSRSAASDDRVWANSRDMSMLGQPLKCPPCPG